MGCCVETFIYIVKIQTRTLILSSDVQSHRKRLSRFSSNAHKDDPRRRTVPVYCASTEGIDLVSNV